MKGKNVELRDIIPAFASKNCGRGNPGHNSTEI
jgi:hypothetical protein